MKRFRIAIIVIFIVLFAANLVLLDYRDIVSRENLSEGLGIICAILMIIAMVMSNRYEARHHNND
jgi:hypothetical protein